MRWLVTLSFLAACAPTIDGPVERQAATDRTDATRLAAQLSALPGAIRADVTLRRPTVDPLTERATPPSAAIVVVVDDTADATTIKRSTIALVRGTAPEIPEPTIVVELGAIRPRLATLGPWRVEASARRGLITVLAAAFALVAGLAGYIAWRARRRR